MKNKINLARIIDMEKLSDSLLILGKLSSDIRFRTRAILQGKIFDSTKIHKYGQDSIILNSLMILNIIDTCSFLDEYEKFFGITSEEQFKDKILEIKRICKPILHTIKKWKDLKKVRNTFFAHNMRSKGNKMIYRDLVNQNAPRTIHEIELLSYCLLLTDYVIHKEFKNEIILAKKNIKFNITPAKEFTKADCWKEVDNLIVKLNQNLKNNNRNYVINLTKKN